VEMPGLCDAYQESLMAFSISVLFPVEWEMWESPGPATLGQGYLSGGTGVPFKASLSEFVKVKANSPRCTDLGAFRPLETARKAAPSS